jgi:hypothetical protein
MPVHAAYLVLAAGYLLEEDASRLIAGRSRYSDYWFEQPRAKEKLPGVSR